MGESIVDKIIGRYPTLHGKHVSVKNIMELGYPYSVLLGWAKAEKVAPWKTEVEINGEKVQFTFYCPNRTRNLRVEDDFLPEDECYDANEFLTFVEDWVRDASLIKRTKEYLFDVHGANNPNARQSLTLERCEREFKLGQSELRLTDFIRFALFNSLEGKPDFAVSDFCILLENGLRLFDSSGKAIDAEEIKSRLQLAESKSFKHDFPQPWTTNPTDWWYWLDKEELEYQVRRYEVAHVYERMGRTEFPWLNLEGKEVWLSTRATPSGIKPIQESFGLAAKLEDYERAFQQDAWTAREALCWLKGRNPIWCRGDIEEYYREESDFVRRAISASRLTWASSTPRQWIEWWKEKGLDIPAAMKRCDKFLKLQPAPQASGEPESRGYIQEHLDDHPPIPSTSEGRPTERRNCWRPIWAMLGHPRRNDKIWNALKARQNKDGFPVVKVFGNDEFEFRYDTGDTERLTRKVFQNDMGDIRKGK